MFKNRSTLATILGVAVLGVASKLKKGSTNEGKILIFSSFEGMRNWIKEGSANPEEVTVIHLKDANISSLPQEILAFKNLEHIYLNNNQFTKLPLILNELNKLEHINLSGNFLDQNSLQDLIYFSGPDSKAKAILTFSFSNNPIDNIPLIAGDLASGKYGRIINTSFYNPYDYTPYDKSVLPNLTYDNLVELVERGFTKHLAIALAYAKGFIPIYKEDEVSPEYIVNLLRTNKLFCYLSERIVFNLRNMEDRSVKHFTLPMELNKAKSMYTLIVQGRGSARYYEDTYNYNLNSYSVTIPEGFRPPNLQHLTFHDLKYIENLSEIQNLPMLTNLSFKGINNMGGLNFLSNLKKDMIVLSFKFCKGMGFFPDHLNTTYLYSLEIENTDLKALPDISDMNISNVDIASNNYDMSYPSPNIILKWRKKGKLNKKAMDRLIYNSVSRKAKSQLRKF
jgi:hypothetical protein